jgi:hypothetical protein
MCRFPMVEYHQGADAFGHPAKKWEFAAGPESPAQIGIYFRVNTSWAAA